MNPYRGLPSTNFWSSGVALAPPGGLDPVTTTKFKLTAADRVATMGSCFAQHISRHIERVGLNYFVTELPPDRTSADEANRRNYRVFSARYGNVYTVRQARQLFERAFGAFEPIDHTWAKGGRFVDALRPQIEPDLFETVDDVAAARTEHLAAVRRLFLESDVVVFTLGLTETFASIHDGTVYPVAPGVHGGEFSDDKYRFVNFSVTEVVEDLECFVDSVKAVNPAVRVLITVSPVPLIASYERRHVLVSNTISKATLRVAAAQVVASREFVDYFPSYEIIAGSGDGTRYFEPDLREVSQRGVDHVMRVFQTHMIDGIDAPQAPVAASDHDRAAYVDAASGVVCDEELIEASLRSAGL